ncbi:MAG: Thiamine biosynthesis lipoprotein ApbE [Bacteroidetes bacterium 38_7]|nr:MAG: Thiamine biosynthesis lipoprotein ApbE [Bacteroidetes bacterium 38_7]
MNQSSSTYYDESSMFHGSLSRIMGTRFDLILTGVESEHSARIWESIQNELEYLDHILNRFDPDSEISVINNRAGNSPVKVNNEMWHILQECGEYHQRTFGLFDITLSDFSQVAFNEKEYTVLFLQPGLLIDLGGYAKGYAMKKLVNILKTNNVENCFVDFGLSAIFALGHHPYGDSWKVSIENPFHKGEILGEIALKNSALSTSGNTPNYSGHIINPLSRKFNTERKLICVESDDPVEAEVLTTALIAADTIQKKKLVTQFDIKQILDYNL